MVAMPAKHSPLVRLFLLCSALACHHSSPLTEAFSSSSVIPCSSRAQHSHVSIASRLRATPAASDGSAVDDASSASPSGTGKHQISSALYAHHVAVKTRNIENAIKFYSLLGFRVESKFVAGPARAAWLLHEGCTVGTTTGPRSRIELLEVPSYMLDEPEGKVRRAIDLTKREELLGLNHFALDVTGNIPRPDNDGGAADDGSACALYQLQEWMDDLNALSLEEFGKSLRIALKPIKRIIGREVYEMAFLYDADGTLVELLNHSGTLEQEMDDGWAPWDGQGFVQ